MAKAKLIKVRRAEYAAEKNDPAIQPDRWLVLDGRAVIAEFETEAEADAYIEENS